MRSTAAIAVGIASLVVCASAAQAQEFDVTHCYAGTTNVVFAADGAVVFTFDHKGIYRANGEKKSLHGMSIHCVGVVEQITPERPQRGGCKGVNPNGDQIFAVFEGSGPVGKVTGTAKAVGGTGAWKGVTGGGKWEVHTGSKPAVPGTFQGCLRYHGEYKVPNK